MYRNKKIFTVIVFFLIINIFLVKFQTITVSNDLFYSYGYLLSSSSSGIDLKNYVYVYSIFCILLYMYINYEKYYTLVKYKSRRAYFLNFQLKNMFIVAIVYSLILYISVAIVGILILGFQNMMFFEYFNTSLIAVFYDIIYFSIVLSLFNIAYTYLNNKVFSIITVEIFLIINYIFNEKNLTLIDIPSKYSIFSMEYDYYKYIPNLIMLIFLCAIIIYIQYILFAKKDIL